MTTNWIETNPGSADYIQNKPTIPETITIKKELTATGRYLDNTGNYSFPLETEFVADITWDNADWQEVVWTTGALKVSDKADLIHNHDDLYFTKEYLESVIASKANVVHNHDNAYYTKAEVDTLDLVVPDHIHAFSDITGITGVYDGTSAVQPNNILAVDNKGKLPAVDGFAITNIKFTNVNGLSASAGSSKYLNGTGGYTQVDYNDLLNKLPSVDNITLIDTNDTLATSEIIGDYVKGKIAAIPKPDWNALADAANEILNKPTGNLCHKDYSTSFDDTDDCIPTGKAIKTYADTYWLNVQPNWTAASGSSGLILNKPDLKAGALLDVADSFSKDSEGTYLGGGYSFTCALDSAYHSRTDLPDCGWVKVYCDHKITYEFGLAGITNTTNLGTAAFLDGTDSLEDTGDLPTGAAIISYGEDHWGTSAVNVQADWNAVPGATSEVLNKPGTNIYNENFTTTITNTNSTLPTSAAVIKYADDNWITVKPNWNSTSGDSEILNKPTGNAVNKDVVTFIEEVAYSSIPTCKAVVDYVAINGGSGGSTAWDDVTGKPDIKTEVGTYTDWVDDDSLATCNAVYELYNAFSGSFAGYSPFTEKIDYTGILNFNKYNVSDPNNITYTTPAFINEVGMFFGGGFGFKQGGIYSLLYLTADRQLRVKLDTEATMGVTEDYSILVSQSGTSVPVNSMGRNGDVYFQY